jgi:hypothetical protein
VVQKHGCVQELFVSVGADSDVCMFLQGVEACRRHKLLQMLWLRMGLPWLLLLLR